MKNKTTTIAVFFTSDNKILLQNRKSISKNGEEWGFFGGSFEEKESVTECLNREIMEELGVNLQNYQYDFLGTREINIEYKEPKIKNKSYIYMVKFNGNLKQFTLGEGDDMKLFSLSEAKKLKIFSFDYITFDMIENYFENKESCLKGQSIVNIN